MFDDNQSEVEDDAAAGMVKITKRLQEETKARYAFKEKGILKPNPVFKNYDGCM